MRYMCFGYLNEKRWEGMSNGAREAFIEECFAYDDVLRKGGHFLGGEALRRGRDASTLRLESGKVSVTDGPYAETKEQLGGVLILEAKDLNHAIQLISKHPGLRNGPFEIRPIAEEISSKIAERSRAAKP